jgi:proteasome accessory factor A
VFTENGGSLYYEFVPTAQEGGLVEAGTPECRGPGQLLLYQRATDQLLDRATRRAARVLIRRGVGGELTLLKNCRDAAGHTYGAQENYEVELATGAGLAGWRLGVLLALPFAVLAGMVHWLLLLGMLLVAIPLGLGALLFMIGTAVVGGEDPESYGRSADGIGVAFDWLGRFEMGVAQVALFPSTFLVALAARAFAFRPQRRGALAFLASRSVISGAGTLHDDGRWTLSEKAPAIRRVMRWSVAPEDRGLLEIGHLIKPLHALAWGNWRGVVALFAPRQRFQLGLSDANRCDVAEYLKLGTTALVLDLVEAGRLADAPQLAEPIAAMHALSGDPSLQASVALASGGSATALELQRFYLERARAWLEEDGVAVSLEAHDLVRLWAEALDWLESDPEELVGRLDWVSKRALVERAAVDDPAVRKKIDLRYHELGPDGYHGWLVEAGLSTVLVDPAEADRAAREPPPDTPARQRGRLVRQLARSHTDARVGWDQVRVGGAMGGKVIRLDQYRESAHDDLESDKI